ncbi:MAG: M3 family oligoendopeptidase [Micavibrio sp.]|nr:M3 family oligoendopeptidase [Micavibrio sp.]
MKAAKANKTRKPVKAALPRWDLSDLMVAPIDRNIDTALKKAAKDALAFQKKYKGMLHKLDGAGLAAAIAAYEKLSEEMSRVYNYANLDRQTKLNDAEAGKRQQTVMETVTDISTELLFFRLDLNKIPDAVLKKQLQHAAAKRYAPFLEQVRAFRPYQLADDVETAVHERSIIGAPAWVRLFDETSARLRFPLGKKQVTESDIFHQLLSRKSADRKAAAKSIEKVLAENIQTYGFILNTIVKEKDIDDRQRGFKTPAQSRNLENQVEDDVVAALVAAVRQEYPRLSHRYYKLKAKWLGVKKMPYWDRNAPLPFSADKKISWDAAKDAVLAAYGSFHADMKKTGQQFFDGGWIDAAPYAGKDSGAFSAPTVPSAHPYILMNYNGGIEDVMTLAHELGHGVHQVLSAKQGYLMADTPLTLAETASVFGEMLTFQSLLKAEKNPAIKRAMLAKKVEDMLNTVVRQIAFHTFEEKVHAERKSGELTPERICEIWMEVMKESLGPAFTFDEGYKYYWAYISHFYHVPFYVYAYAFGDCLVNALYAVYQDSEKGFAEKYLHLLQQGGTQRYDELLKPFGLDARDPGFWKKGLKLIESFIDQLESGEKLVKVRK